MSAAISSALLSDKSNLLEVSVGSQLNLCPTIRLITSQVVILTRRIHIFVKVYLNKMSNSLRLTASSTGHLCNEDDIIISSIFIRIYIQKYRLCIVAHKSCSDIP